MIVRRGTPPRIAPLRITSQRCATLHTMPYRAASPRNTALRNAPIVFFVFRSASRRVATHRHAPHRRASLRNAIEGIPMRTLSALRLSVLHEQLRSTNDFLEGVARSFEEQRPVLAGACRVQIERNNEAIAKTNSSVLTFPTEETTQ